MSNITISTNSTQPPSGLTVALFWVSWSITIVATLIGFLATRPETGLPWIMAGQLPMLVLAGLMPVVFLRNQARLSSAMFIGSTALGNGLSLFFSFMSGRAPDESVRLTFALLAFIPSLCAGWVMLILFYRMWAAIQDGQARTTPAKAVGFLLIPVFNFYWAFQAIWGFAKDYNRYIDRHNIHTAHLSETLFLVYVVLSFTTWIPILGLFLLVINYFVAMAMIASICSAVNTLMPAPTPGLQLS